MEKRFTLKEDGGLITKGLPYDILHSYENIPAEIFEEASEACKEIARHIALAINENHSDRKFKLGLSTGTSTAPLFEELVKLYDKKEVSFADVEVFSIDEYYPIEPFAPQSRNKRLQEMFLSKVDIKEENIHVPDSTVPDEKLSAYCAKFDKLASDLDILVLGAGEQGQVGFNDAGASPRTRTRCVQMSYKNHKRQAANFNGDLSVTPKTAITMGMATMMGAKEIIIMCWGENKAQTVYNITEGPRTDLYPASLFQGHGSIKMYIDNNAASLLTRNVAPWCIGPCEWTSKMIRKALVWLCGQVGKPILKLSQEDYLEHSLGELLQQKGPYDKINIDVFNDLQHTITGWPGGKPNADDSTRPVPSVPAHKRVVIFSPHPDDDVISMGGTFIRLVEQHHEVHVAYETSGNVAVHDDVVYQQIDATRELGYADKVKELEEILAGKKPGEPEPRALLDLKAAIRRSEARAAVRSFGLDENNNVHFLNLPFYETGGIIKGKRSQKDTDIIKALLDRIKPHQIYIAGDLADPHGTHRVCTEAVLEALDQMKDEQWLKECHCWMYRGAWMEWELGRVDMAVPLSPDELIKKRHAIFRHRSQKDIVPFPGDDSREFWQRAEERTQNTACQYDKLGMAEYQAIEVFVKLF